MKEKRRGAADTCMYIYIYRYHRGPYTRRKTTLKKDRGNIAMLAKKKKRHKEYISTRAIDESFSLTRGKREG
jgi:hypothetical protein